jgi:subtilisin-like proprotein convertase family protein
MPTLRVAPNARSRRFATALAMLWACAVAPAHAEVAFDYLGAAISIPDNTPAGVSAVVSVSGLNAITDLDFRLSAESGCNATPGNVNAAITHTFVGDLTLKLTSPQGTQVTLIERRGGTRENFCTTTLDDEGNFPSLSTISSITGSFVSGSYAPESPLSAFDGESPNGQWVLNISDNAGGDTGVLRHFTLILTTVPNVINVDVLDDPVPGSCTPGSCSLREAVSLANSLPGPERIVLPGSAMSITRAGAGDDGNSTGDIDITDDLEIVGAGANATILTQSANDRVFHVIGTGVDFSLRSARVQGGNNVADGGAVHMPGNGNLLIENAIFSGHRASNHGGAIHHNGGGSMTATVPKIILRNTVFDDNRVTDATSGNAYGGAMYSYSSGFQQNYLLIDGCTFNNNRADNGGGALGLDGVQSVSNNSGLIANSSFTLNQVTADGPGGAVGINVEGNGLFALTVDNVLFEQNSVPSGGANSGGGALSLRNSAAQGIYRSFFMQNTARIGGAVSGDVLEIVDSSFCINTAVDQGGALSLGAFDTIVRRSTLCANTATTANTALFGGGAIAKPAGNLQVERSTLDGNSAVRGAAIAFGGNDLFLRSNTIVAPSPLPAGALGSVLRYTNTDTTDGFGLVNNILIGQCSFSSAINPGSAFNNVEASGNTCRLLTATLQAGNQTVVSGNAINLGTLAQNGGPTNTRLPVAPSIAIDAASTFACTFLDQRGFQRTDALCDVGAVEVGGIPPPDALFANGFE